MNRGAYGPHLGDLPLAPDFDIDGRACRTESRELFFDPDGLRGTNKNIRQKAAKAVCFRCHVRKECLAWALRIDDEFAILGGTTPAERRRLRRGRPGQTETTDIPGEWRDCDNPDCNMQFYATRADRRFCNTSCSKRAMYLRRKLQAAA